MKKIISLMMAAMLLVALCACGENEVVSGSDIDTEQEEAAQWEMASNDEEYFVMMKAKLDEYIRCMTELSDMEKRLSKLGDEQKIAEDAQFAAISERFSDWCEGAAGYPVDMLINDSAKNICLQLRELAGATAVYLEKLPAMLADTYTDELSIDDYKNSIVDSAVAIYQELVENSENEE